MELWEGWSKAPVSLRNAINKRIEHAVSERPENICARRKKTGASSAKRMREKERTGGERGASLWDSSVAKVMRL